MTNEDRQTVIDALERAASTCFTAYAHHEFMSDPKNFMREALAIMRREREPCEHMWMPNGCCFHCGKYNPRGT